MSSAKRCWGGRRPVRDLVTARSTSSARVRAYFDEGRDAFEPGAGRSSCSLASKRYRLPPLRSRATRAGRGPHLGRRQASRHWQRRKRFHELSQGSATGYGVGPRSSPVRIIVSRVHALSVRPRRWLRVSSRPSHDSLLQSSGQEENPGMRIWQGIALMLTLGWLTGVALAADAPSQDATPSDRTPPRLSFVDGQVSFWRPGAQDWAQAQVNTPHAAFTIERAGYYRVDVTGERTAFITRRGGRATVTPVSEAAVGIAPSEEVIIEGPAGARVASYAARPLDAWDRWNYARTDHLLDAVSARGGVGV